MQKSPCESPFCKLLYNESLHTSFHWLRFSMQGWNDWFGFGVLVPNLLLICVQQLHMNKLLHSYKSKDISEWVWFKADNNWTMKS